MSVKQIRNIGIILFLCMMVLLPVQVFAESKTITAQIPVSCIASNFSETFTYNLIPEIAEHQIIKSRTIALKDKEKGKFEITYTYPGTYHYKVNQNSGSDEKTIYDDTVYQVDVYVTEDDKRNLFAEVIAYIEGDTAKKSILLFTNLKESTNESDSNHSDEGDESTGESPQNHSNSGYVQPEVKTGDTANIVLWGSVLIVSLGAICVVLANKKKRNRL